MSPVSYFFLSYLCRLDYLSHLKKKALFHECLRVNIELIISIAYVVVLESIMSKLFYSDIHNSAKSTLPYVKITLEVLTR